MIDTDLWPVVKARWFTKWASPGSGRRPVRVIVMHDMEAPEKGETAENVARYFATTDTKASSHICVDNNTIVQCVKDNDIAYAAPGCNSDGIQIELAGYGRQTRAEWLDPYSLALIDLGANATAQYCLKYDIPPRQLTNTLLLAGARGIIGHYQASAVYKKSNHTDPGANFPWEHFMELVNVYHRARREVYASARPAA